MLAEGTCPKNRDLDFHSRIGEIYLPFTVAALPAGLFMLLGFVAKGLDKPAAEPSLLVIVTMLLVQTLGMTAMAFVFLIRLDLGLRSLMYRAKGHPSIWRTLTLKLSFAFLLIFDILTNVAAAFAGAGFLFIAAIPIFLAYLAFNRLAFATLSQSAYTGDTA
jgi:hypothetical protein